MKKVINLLGMLSTGFLLSACLYTTSEQTTVISQPKVLIGQLFDAPLTNIHYHSEHFTGITSSQGEFLYVPDDNITFTLGSYQFANVKAAPHLSLRDLFPSNQTHNSVINLTRLLGSINEITQDNKVILPNLNNFNLAALDFSQSLILFAKDPLVLKLLQRYGNQLNAQQLVPSEIVFEQLQIMDHHHQGIQHSPNTALQVSAL